MPEYKKLDLTEKVTQILDPTGVSCFLVQGRDRAVLIDTGTGLKGLKELTESLTKLPLEVILTHGHGDHAGGVGAFENVYLHPADAELVREHGVKMRMEYAASMMGPDVQLTESMFIPEPDGGFRELADGQVFELGGEELEIIHVPGHTRGCCCVLLREERSVLYGDACNVNTLLMEEGTGIRRYRESLRYLKTFDEAYDTVYYSHGPAVGPRQCLDDNLELCDRILAGTDDAIPCEFMGKAAYRAAGMGEDFRRLDGRYGNIVYTEEKRYG